MPRMMTVVAVLLACVLLVASAAQSITVTVPNASTVWTHGQMRTFAEWSGAPGSQIIALLYLGGDSVGVYHGWTANDGHCDRTSPIPSEWGTGTDFQVKVLDDLGNFGWSSEFEIRAGIPNVAHWTFDEMTGDTLHDVGGYGHHGIVSGAAWSPGYNGGALCFDGIDDRVTTSFVPVYNNADSYTWEAIISYNMIHPYWGVICGFEHTENGQIDLATDELAARGHAFGLSRSDNYRHDGGQHFLFSLDEIHETGWRHLALVRDRANLKYRFYVDGELQQEMDDSNINAINAAHRQTLGIGCQSHNNTWDFFFNGCIDEIRISDVALDPSQFLPFGPQEFIVSGTVVGPGGGLLGVPVELVDAVGDPVAATATDEWGAYAFEEVPNGENTVSIVVPLGYTADDDSKEITVAGDDVVCDFYLEPVQTMADPRSAGFWKHQLKVYLTGNGSAQIPVQDFLSYLARIGQHFNNNPVNPVTLYTVEPGATWLDSLQAAYALLETKGRAPMSHLAGRQLMALLLNVTSDMLPQFTLVSADGATASQAITYCWMLIDDGIPLNDETPKDIGDEINNGILVPPGVIPANTEDISYGHPGGAAAVPATFVLYQNHPNPAQPVTTIRYGLSEGCRVLLTVHNILGEAVAELVNEQQAAGYHTATWDATGRPAGVCFYTLRAGEVATTRRLTVVK